MYTAGRRIMVLERARCAKRVGLTLSQGVQGYRAGIFQGLGAVFYFPASN